MVCFRGSGKRDVSELLFLKVVLGLTVCFDGSGKSDVSELLFLKISSVFMETEGKFLLLLLLLLLLLRSLIRVI